MKDSAARYHFVNVVKVTKDFLGEHCSPLSESDCMALCAKADLVDSINKALESAGIDGLKIQLNWSEDQGQSWVQYPKSRQLVSQLLIYKLGTRFQIYSESCIQLFIFLFIFIASIMNKVSLLFRMFLICRMVVKDQCSIMNTEFL